MSAGDRARMIARYVRTGGNPATGAALLDDLIGRHDGENLAAALAYWGFTPAR